MTRTTDLYCGHNGKRSVHNFKLWICIIFASMRPESRPKITSPTLYAYIENKERDTLINHWIYSIGGRFFKICTTYGMTIIKMRMFGQPFSTCLLLLLFVQCLSTPPHWQGHIICEFWHFSVQNICMFVRQNNNNNYNNPFCRCSVRDQK